MEILVARHLGFCYGVMRAVEMVEKLVQAQDPVYTLGPLIHNPQAIARLADRGVRQAEEVEEIATGTVVLRTHGVPPALLAKTRQRNLTIADATCPYVKKAQREAEELSRQGYQVVILGEANHPEVVALSEWAGGALVISGPEEAANLPTLPRIGLIAQTTQSPETFHRVREILKEKSENLRLINTICRATDRRQEAAREVAREVEVVIVVGGKNSANTRRLLSIVQEMGRKGYHIEEAWELQPGWFAGVARAGVVAGASTPDWIIKEVVRKMEEMEEKRLENAEGEKKTEALPVQAEENPPEKKVAMEEGPPTAEPTSAGETQPGETEESGPAYDATFGELKPGDIVRGTVVKVEGDGVLVDIGYKSEGVVPIGELSRRRVEHPSEVVKAGDEISVFVLRVEGEEGTLKLSKRRADEKESWQRLVEAKETGAIIEGEALQEVKGGLIVDVGARGFVPASHVGRGYVADLSKYVGQKLRMKVLELDQPRGRAVLSQKLVLEEEHEKQRKETWDSLQEGQVRTGVVKSLTEFGAFVDLGGVDGLLHVSELSWGRVKHPADVLKEGETIQVKVLKVDREKGKVSLGLRQLLPDPWEKVAVKYPEGSVIPVRVTRLASFGAFVELEEGVEGLIHISELSDHRVAKTEDVLSPGQVVNAKVIKVRPADKKIGLTLRGVPQDTQAEEAAADADVGAKVEEPGQ
ncbi:MAG: bifunctional 4-hydroxy-3-methylbut-2-enyl diphosphate reductase/30S ribosomal protein S1 [Firmicutes bacterium]|nr:bifunctional 4-hydroxy-3-methylbut-2-enyl diphosphate reductase/30S ribosomal protein S1 [Bacillota bacterium]MCL5040587.1 bifunctional 4-hydroxy-3-methylbut-2-enyl diphosphate reductase/30S ribosomal protein S1 [Bacillota bacterium]